MDIQNKQKEYRKSETTVYSCQYHVVFCPKYRRPVLIEPIGEKIKELAPQYCETLGIMILDMEVMPDHVHLLMDIPPTFVVRNAVTRLKGFLSHELRTMFPKLKSRLPSLWSRSSFISSVGAVSLEEVKRYIDNQKNK